MLVRRFLSGRSDAGILTVLVSGDSQFIAILYALNTFYMVYMLIPHTTQRDNDPVSRLNKQFVIVNFLLLCWVLSVGMIPLTVGADIKPTLTHCFSTHFMSPKCITLGLDAALPFALILTRAFDSAFELPLICVFCSGYNLVDDLPRRARSPGAGCADAPAHSRDRALQVAPHASVKSCCARSQGAARRF
ncbi:hypothetical protein B0H17DRAFT_1096618 [Mycena rosella]|uniref:Uncharacterized protein n=1 Tax=Mycena rosella TaxID=1033263 RepID=A0AAD7CQQ2_MYCRO|nr:hypothetical protein B0H17DRAFT_1096618 [Mycena rosella]